MTDTKNTPEREDLPEAVQQRLEKLLKKDPVKLNSSQKGFIKGRSAYLTKQEMSDFSVIFDTDTKKKPEKKAPEPKEAPEETETEEEETEDDKNTESDYSEMGRNELFAEVDSRNEGRSEALEISKGGTNDDIIERLEADDKA
jgi:hypothetical protein